MLKSQEPSEPYRVIYLKSKKRKCALFPHKQHGAVLILMAFIIGLAMTGLLIKSYTASSIQAERDEDTMRILMQAKEAMIAWAVSHDTAPGQFPWPDRRETTNPNYDGQSDCSSANFNLLNSLNEPNFLGQIPSIASTTPCLVYPGAGNQFRDSDGSNLWYAVSRNLVRKYSAPAANPVINPGIIDNPTYPWMVVRDAAGTIVSNRVAVVIMAPGSAINNQNRSGTAPLPANFLDEVTINSISYRNFDYDTDDEDFIMGNVTGGSFNDKLVYITIDELIDALERRVGEVARAQLKNYQDTYGYYPYAAQLGTTTNYTPEQNKTSGFLPVDYQKCEYRRVGTTFLEIPITTPHTYLENCEELLFDASLSGISSVRFTSAANSFTSSTGLCVASGTQCTCTGAGSCTRSGILQFVCTSNGCESEGTILDVSAWGTYMISGGKFTSAQGSCTQPSAPTKTADGCTNSDSQITCTGSAGGVFSSSEDEPFASFLPSWFKDNNWQDYVYYHFTRPASTTMEIGAKPAEALVATTGRAINSAPFPSKGAAQLRPSCSTVNDYLDSVENADGDAVYEATTEPRSSNYNDQNFVVSP